MPHNRVVIMISAQTLKKYWFLVLSLGIFLIGAASRISAANPALFIVQPSPNSTVVSPIVPLKFAVSDFKIVDFRTNPHPALGQGHIHLWVDQSTLSAQSAIKIVSNSYVLENLKPGFHTVYAELVSNNHQPFTPPITTALSFRIVSPNQIATSVSYNTVFQLTALTVVLLLIALYFTHYQIQTLTKPSPAKKKKA